MAGTQRVTFAVDGLMLEGVLHDPQASLAAPGAVACHPHPLYGGDMYNSVVVTVCEALAAAGIAALRFNFRGTGRNAGSHGGGLGERDDVRAALDFLAANDEVDAKRLFLAGYSFGATVALATGYEGLSALAAISPPLGGESARMLSLACPALLVFGERDSVAPVENLERLGIQLPEGSRVVVVPGADHFWGGLEKKAAGEVVGFFKEWTAVRR